MRLSPPPAISVSHCRQDRRLSRRMLKNVLLPVAFAVDTALLVGCRAVRSTPTSGSEASASTSARDSQPAERIAARRRSGPDASARSAASGSTVAPAPSIDPLAQPAAVERLEVPGQAAAWMVKSLDGRPPRNLFLPGVCSNAAAYLYGFAETARAFGGALAIDGDRPCGAGGDFHSITSDPNHEQPRIDRALAAAGWSEPERAKVVLIGYSLGAKLVENLVRQSPERYPRVVLIGSPRDPQVARLRGARAVATLSCSLDVPARMRGAAVLLERAGIASRYFEMPDCTHGNLADGERIFAEVFRWLALDGRGPASDANANSK